ncbi:Uncharacterized protein ALO43_05488 [Pseudomonas tremae]|uniref:Uncharacterized protein n=1 Tax=Pseudomonas tremae TaxID=200454 RepID=A0AA40TUW0_9PSED|nr:Uncharacterized protein ALO43_05488 [Pseudomonas tremae]RMP33688.1 hypothetical protein ALQ25_01426 [Pseudomonas coronafaciens pv. atropurpurea]
MPCAQGLFDRLVEQALSTEPAAGIQVQTSGLRACCLSRAQKIGKQVVIAKPVALLVQRHEKHLMRLQVAQYFAAVMGVPRRIAQLGAKTLQTGSVVQKSLNIGWQAVDHFFKQVLANQYLTATQRLRQGAFVVSFGSCQQPESQTGHPAFAALNEALQRLAVQRTTWPGQHGNGLRMGQAQVLFIDFKQLPGQTQTCKVPLRTLPTGDHHNQADRQVVEEELQTAVKHRALSQVVIIQHQQQRFAQQQMQGQLVEQAVEPFFECERLMTLTHLHQPHRLGAQLWKQLLKASQKPLQKTARVAVACAQSEPHVLPFTRQPLTELDCQRTLAETGRGAHQQQPTAQPLVEALAQAGTGNVTFGKWWAKKTPLQRRNRAVCEPLHSGQISHGRLVWGSVFRHRGVRRLAVKSALLKVHHRKDCNKIPTAYKADTQAQKSPIQGAFLCIGH